MVVGLGEKKISKGASQKGVWAASYVSWWGLAQRVDCVVAFVRRFEMDGRGRRCEVLSCVRKCVWEDVVWGF